MEAIFKLIQIKDIWSLLFQMRLLRRLWDLSLFLNLISSCLRYRMSSREKWWTKSNVLCVVISRTSLLNVDNAISFSASIVSYNYRMKRNWMVLILWVALIAKSREIFSKILTKSSEIASTFANFPTDVSRGKEG